MTPDKLTLEQILDEFWNSFASMKTRKKNAKKQLLDLFKRCVPEEAKSHLVCWCDCLPCHVDGDCSKCNVHEYGFSKNQMCYNDVDSGEADAFNLCRQQMLDRLEEMRK